MSLDYLISPEARLVTTSMTRTSGTKPNRPVAATPSWSS